MQNWINILTYAGYWDFARVFLIKINDQLYVFDSYFDEEIDDYTDYFAVYRIPDRLNGKHDDMAELRKMIWDFIKDEQEAIIKIPVSEITFDETRKSMIKADFLEKYPLS